VTAILERTVWLRTLYVSDEVRGITPIHELANVAELLHVRPTSKHSQVVNCRLRPMPGLIWREPGKALRQEPVQEVDRSHHHPPKNSVGIPLCLKSARSITTTAWFYRSTTPICYEV
jgi:hypothetical protein